jgi:peroxiredoxin
MHQPDQQQPSSVRPPRWMLFARAGAVLVVVAVIVVAVVLQQRHGPQAPARQSGQSVPLTFATPPGAAVATPAESPDGPIGALESGIPTVGKPAPDFALTDLQGRRIHLSSLRGKVVVVNFWATWCGPCKEEFPELQKAASQLSDDVIVLALDQSESAAKVEQFRDQFGATFAILLDSRNAVAEAYRLQGIPDTIFIGRDGVVRDVALGPLSAGTFRYKINQALNAR